jgi:hypothetical protein
MEQTAVERVRELLDENDMGNHDDEILRIVEEQQADRKRDGKVMDHLYVVIVEQQQEITRLKSLKSLVLEIRGREQQQEITRLKSLKSLVLERLRRGHFGRHDNEEMTLFPCPFCGSSNIEPISKWWNRLHCADCGATSPRIDRRDADGYMNAWNRRIGTSALLADIKRGEK